MTVAERTLAGLALDDSDDDPILPPCDRHAEQQLVRLAAFSDVWLQRILAQLDPAELFDGRWRRALEHLKAGEPLPEAYDVEYTWLYLYGCGLPREPVHELVDRVKRCAEARRLISIAQQIAERAWRVPERPFSVADAVRILDGLRSHDVVCVEVD